MTGEIAALGTALCWAFTGLFFAEASRRVGAWAVNLLRLPLAFVLLSSALLVTGTSLTSLNVSHATLLAASGVVGLTIGDLALFAAQKRIGARLSALLMALAPIFATAAGLALLGELPGPGALLGIGVTLAGVAWVVLERRDGEAHPLEHRGAIALALVAAACQGIGLVLAKMGMAGTVPPLAATWVRMAVATVAIWGLAAATGRVGWGPSSGVRGPSAPPTDRPSEVDARPGIRAAARRAAWPVIGGAVSGPFIGVWLSLIAARYTDVGVAATLMATTPVLIIPLVIAVERYRPTWRAVIGTVVTVAGVALLFSH